ncbi:hypothetical protein Fot_04084 [Forsythia ovata]|uniref:Uncharacterized protein n=1 Tax=Forsythia ovata TaxID=205694 RepID=A0ABD1XCF3_9LAMI
MEALCDQSFTDFLLRIGDGQEPNKNEDHVSLLDEMLIQELDGYLSETIAPVEAYDRGRTEVRILYDGFLFKMTIPYFDELATRKQITKVDIQTRVANDALNCGNPFTLVVHWNFEDVKISQVAYNARPDWRGQENHIQSA